MEKLKTMLINRFHPADIIEYIKTNIDNLVEINPNKFINSLLNPELLKPVRFISYFPTSLFFLNKEIIIPSNTILNFQFDQLYDLSSKLSSLKLNNTPNYDLNIHENIAKMYRITACGLYINDEFIHNGNTQTYKKIIYLPLNINHLNYKLINETNYHQDITLKIINKSTIKIIQHIEFVPYNNDTFCSKKQTKELDIFEKIIQYKSSMITDYNAKIPL